MVSAPVIAGTPRADTAPRLRQLRSLLAGRRRPIAVLAGLLAAGLAAPATIAGAAVGQELRVQTSGLGVQLSPHGEITALQFGQETALRPMRGEILLQNCRVQGTPTCRALAGGGYEFTREWRESAGPGQCLVTERFLPRPASLRWEVEIRGTGQPWSTPIETRLAYPLKAAPALFWTAWSDPQMGRAATAADPGPAANQAPGEVLIPFRRGNHPRTIQSLLHDNSADWADPLIPQPFRDALLYYGAPAFDLHQPRLAFTPFRGDLFALPLATVLDSTQDLGFSLVLDPRDVIPDLELALTAEGEIRFRRLFLRIDGEQVVRFAADLVPHEADWRGGLCWMTANYPEFFDPPLPTVSNLAGLGAYSAEEGPLDVGKLKRMGFRTNWKASFDFAYMGMFLPPVRDEAQTWRRYFGEPTSVAKIRDYHRRMRADGFYALQYFNVSEFGAHIAWPLTAPAIAEDEPTSQTGAHYLVGPLAQAIIRLPENLPSQDLALYGKSSPGGPIFTWENGIVLDCGDAGYETFLLEQVQRHLQSLPESAGFVVDRGDWVRLYNLGRDDGTTWFDNQPAASLRVSWQRFMDKFGPLAHAAGKVIFVNNHDKRIDLLRHVDGVFDESTYGSGPLNLTALDTLRKPALGWTVDERDLQPDPDAFFQKYLYLGVYPMAPFPKNDHSIQPTPWAEKQYLDYGPLFDSLRGKRWVLTPHIVEAVSQAAKVNFFEVESGYALPVTYAGSATTVEVLLHGALARSRLTARALLPGREEHEAVSIHHEGDSVRLTVPVHRGCAVVLIQADRTASPP